VNVSYTFADWKNAGFNPNDPQADEDLPDIKKTFHGYCNPLSVLVISIWIIKLIKIENSLLTADLYPIISDLFSTINL